LQVVSKATGYLPVTPCRRQYAVAAEIGVTVDDTTAEDNGNVPVVPDWIPHMGNPVAALQIVATVAPLTSQYEPVAHAVDTIAAGTPLIHCTYVFGDVHARSAELH
jgi:hypothetical protein